MRQETGLPANGREHDRRSKKRFSIQQEVRYKMSYRQRIAETGAGKTVNVSSGGLWIITESTLTPGWPVELAMNWPVLLHNACPMKLMIYGRVIRSSGKAAAITIDRYEFRTQGSRTFRQAHDQSALSMAT